MTTATAAYDFLATAFTDQNPKSRALYQTATHSLPGGNTRSSLFYTPFPLSMTHAEGSNLTSADGQTYTDLLGEFSAGLYGHSEPEILSAITAALKHGLSYGSQHADEARLAAAIQTRFPSIELLRFTNSGTEATLMALAAARAHTRKSCVLVFAGAYHGGAFSFRAGRQGAANAPGEFLVARYNDLESVRALLRKKADPMQQQEQEQKQEQEPEQEQGPTATRKLRDDVAAILVEPMLGSGGAIPAQAGFLEGLRAEATRCGAVLVFDEVMTSRMHGGGGVQSRLHADARPDLTLLGKYIGGGLSFGAFGGKREIMAQFDPRRGAGALGHAGTFNNNVLSMAAGRAGLERVFTAARAEALHARGERLRAALNAAGAGTMLKVTGYGSIMAFHFSQTPVEKIYSPSDVVDGDAAAVAATTTALYGILHLFLLEKGYYIARRGYLALSLALTDAQLDGFVQAVQSFVAQYRHLLQLQQ